MDINEIESRASRALEVINYDPLIRIDVDSIHLARQFGFTVSEMLMLPNDDDYLVTINKEKSIGVNQNRAKDDKRLAIAYAIALYLLYYEGSPLTFTGKVKDGEADAVAMAECLLMPKVPFHIYYTAVRSVSHSETVAVGCLQETFKVTQWHVRHRLDLMK